MATSLKCPLLPEDLNSWEEVEVEVGDEVRHLLLTGLGKVSNKGFEFESMFCLYCVNYYLFLPLR